MDILIRDDNQLLPLGMWLDLPCRETSFAHRACACEDCVLVRIQAATAEQAEAENQRAIAEYIEATRAPKKKQKSTRAYWLFFALWCAFWTAVITSGNLPIWPWK